MITNFIKYILIGILNTLLHWVVFYLLIYFEFKQSFSNLIGFFISVTFSYCANSYLNFKSSMSLKKYFLFVVGMGAIVFFIGFMGDHFSIFPLIILVVTSGSSLILGFLFSKFFVFKEVL